MKAKIYRTKEGTELGIELEAESYAEGAALYRLFEDKVEANRFSGQLANARLLLTYPSMTTTTTARDDNGK